MSFTSCFLLTVTFFTKSNNIKKKKEKLEKRACTGRGSRRFSTSTPFSSSALHVLPQWARCRKTQIGFYRHSQRSLYFSITQDIFYNPSTLSFPMFSPMLKSFCCFIYQGCGCHMVGSVSPTCSTNGRCRCKPGFGGYKCDRCISSTYYGFPNCKRKWIFLLRWLKHSIVSTVDF